MDSFEIQWNKFAMHFNKFWNNTPEQQKMLKELDNNMDIATVVWYFIGSENAHKWINEKVPALDNMSAVECIGNEVLKTKLKKVLMRMH